MESPASSPPDAFPRRYAVWRCRTLVGAVVATAAGIGLHGSPGEIRFEFGGESPPLGLVLGLVALAVCGFGPWVVGAALGLAAVWSWRRLGTSARLARAAWALWVLGPLPVLLLPLSYLFDLNLASSLRTSVGNVVFILTVITPALFAVVPGALTAALVLKRFLPESPVPGQLTLLAAPACAVGYLLPLAVLAQLVFIRWLYLGLLLLAVSPLVPLLAVRWLLRREAANRATRQLRLIALGQGALSTLGVAVIVGWLAGYPEVRELLGQISPVWALGLVAKVLASKWLTTVVVTDLLLSMLHQGRESARSLADTPEGKALAEKLDALGRSFRPAEPRAG